LEDMDVPKVCAICREPRARLRFCIKCRRRICKGCAVTVGRGGSKPIAECVECNERKGSEGAAEVPRPSPGDMQRAGVLWKPRAGD